MVYPIDLQNGMVFDDNELLILVLYLRLEVNKLFTILKTYEYPYISSHSFERISSVSRSLDTRHTFASEFVYITQDQCSTIIITSPEPHMQSTR